MVDYGLALYGNEGQIKRKKATIESLRKFYPKMRHNPVIAKLEFCVVRVSDYDRDYFEDYASKCLSNSPKSWVKSKGGVLVQLLSLPLLILLKRFRFKPFKPVSKYKTKDMDSATQVVGLLLGRHEDDYFNLIPSLPKPKAMYKHPERFIWNWRVGMAHALLYGMRSPIPDATSEEMKKANDEIKKSYEKRKRVQRV